MSQEYFDLGLKAYYRGDLQVAVAHFRKAIQSDPSSRTYASLGNALTGLRKLDEAVVACRRAIELDPCDPVAHASLAYALQSQRRIREATARYARAAGMCPSNATLQYNLGVLFCKDGREAQGADHFEQAVKLDPCHPRAHYNLGLVCARLGRLDKAVRAFARAVALDASLGIIEQPDLLGPVAVDGYLQGADPHTILSKNDIGLALYRKGKLKEAVAVFRQAIQLDPRCASAYNNLGVALHDLRRLREAEAAFRRATQLRPHFTRARHNLSLVLYGLGRTSKALGLFCQDEDEVDTYSAISNPDDEDNLPFPLATNPNFPLASAYRLVGDALYGQRARRAEVTDAYRNFLRLANSDPDQEDAICRVQRRLEQLGVL